jgi:methionyl-tRNA formyltransferase
MSTESSVVDRVVLFGDTVGLPRVLSAIGPDRVRGVVRASIRPEQEEALAALAARFELPLLEQPRRESPEYAAFATAVRDLAPDLILCDSYSMLLGDDLLEVPPLGCLNVHGGLLPEYRGANPIQWALINDEREAGVTMHRMTAAVDAGPIVAQRRVPIRFTDSWVEVKTRVDQATQAILAEELPRVLRRDARAAEQDEDRARTFPRRTGADGLIDWGDTVLQIYNLIRALVAPLPGAFYESAGSEVVLDSPLSISDVVSLKYGSAGGRRFMANGIELAPDASGAPDALSFEALDRDGSTIGHVEMHGIDWELRTAALRGPAAGGTEERARTRAVLRDFAQRELGLAVELT